MKLLILSMMLLSFTSCKYGRTFSDVKNLEGKRISVENVQFEDLDVENQKVLRDYFSSLKEVAYEFKNSKYIQRYTHRKFFKYFDKSLCNKVLLSQETYKRLMNKCNVSGFYICSEEVKYYVQILTEMKSLLTDVEISNIRSDSMCESKLLELGVLNE